MGCSLKDEEAQHLATELNALTGETLKRAGIVALQERITRLRQQRQGDDLIVRAQEIIRQSRGLLCMIIMLPCSMMSRASRNDHRYLTEVIDRVLAQYNPDQHCADHVSYYGTVELDVLLSHLSTHVQVRSHTLVRSEGDTHGGEILTMVAHRATPTAQYFTTTLTTAAIHLTLAAE